MVVRSQRHSDNILRIARHTSPKSDSGVQLHHHVITVRNEAISTYANQLDKCILADNIVRSIAAEAVTFVLIGNYIRVDHELS